MFEIPGVQHSLNILILREKSDVTEVNRGDIHKNQNGTMLSQHHNVMIHISYCDAAHRVKIHWK